jgi:type VI secretion system secreted protein Hcp
MRRPRLSAALLVTASLVFAPVASAAVDAFIWFEGIAGESRDAQHMGWTEVSSFQLQQIRSSAGVGSATGGAGGGKVSFHDISITKHTDKSSPTLMKFCANGKHIPNATISMRKAGGTQQEYLVIKLQDVLVSSYRTSGAGAGMTETFTMNAANATIQYPPTPRPNPAAVAPMPAGAVRK